MLQTLSKATFFAASTLNVVANALAYFKVAAVAKVFIMLPLIAWAIMTPRNNASRSTTSRKCLFVVSLFFAWAGDLFLISDDKLFFVLGLGSFAAQQLGYIISFLTVPGKGVIRNNFLHVLPYALAWAAINAALSGTVGAFRVPAMVYSGLVCCMASSALELVGRNIHRDRAVRIAVGGWCFCASDAVLALREFHCIQKGPLVAAFVMASYAVAQWLIVSEFVGALCSSALGKPTKEK